MPGASAVLSEVFSGLAAEAGSFAAAAVEAVELPHDLCTAWLTTCGPEVDLCDLQLTSLQWTRLVDCFSHAAPQLEALHTLHIPADVFPHDETDGVPESRDLTALEHILRSCSKQTVEHACPVHGLTRVCCLDHFVLGFSCRDPPAFTVCPGFCMMAHSPRFNITSLSSSSISAAANLRKSLVKKEHFLARAPASDEVCNQCHTCRRNRPGKICPGFQSPHCHQFIIEHTLARESSVLPLARQIKALDNSTGIVHAPKSKTFGMMLWDAVACMPNLQHIGVHDLQPSLHTATALGQLLSCAPPSVSKLTLTISDTGKAADFPNDVEEKMLLFKAVASLKGLRELVMPQWEAVVGQHASECVAVLKGMPVFETVYVAEVKDSSAFPPGVDFRTITEDV
jgi:hypothetical protein